jgi:hypothetical protein
MRIHADPDSDLKYHPAFWIIESHHTYIVIYCTYRYMRNKLDEKELPYPNPKCE